MYRCQVCRTQVPRGVRCRLLIDRRAKVYKAIWVIVRRTPANKARVWRDLRPERDIAETFA